MTNQKELTVRQIRTMLNKTGIATGRPLNRTTKELKLSLENEQTKEQLYICYSLCLQYTKLTRQLKRQQLKNSTNTVQIQH